MTTHCSSRPATVARGPSTHSAGLRAILGRWRHRSRSRRELAELPPYLLKDIGLNEADRYQEVSKPFWQP
ncbi:hypothetical protein GU3_09590 [Oceanimonas sp. GK1]|uniref:DUF1127 domain-containing protein n=1 Tax=Oceanimonas sp. (strain GK1 / IBRC-M 10197) TaxID=511062 RepID=UPI0002494E49|nr:DUF1127 domain-containing protein [Oceanimonas sp. GK1]AEY01674.1 hypothetical protein GU3_09590 [Oceanimonas sp. GK1]